MKGIIKTIILVVVVVIAGIFLLPMLKNMLPSGQGDIGGGTPASGLGGEGQSVITPELLPEQGKETSQTFYESTTNNYYYPEATKMAESVGSGKETSHLIDSYSPERSAGYAVSGTPTPSTIGSSMFVSGFTSPSNIQGAGTPYFATSQTAIPQVSKDAMSGISNVLSGSQSSYNLQYIGKPDTQPTVIRKTSATPTTPTPTPTVINQAPAISYRSNNPQRSAGYTVR